MKTFKDWIQEGVGKGLITFDFDSTMTKPYWDADNELWNAADPKDENAPHGDNIKLMRKYAEQGYDIKIVTSRSPSQKHEIEDFVKRYNLPVSEIICTDGSPKGPILQNMGVLIHHDDLEQKHEDPGLVFKGKWVKIYHPYDGF